MAELNPLRDPILGNIKEVEAKTLDKLNEYKVSQNAKIFLSHLMIEHTY